MVWVVLLSYVVILFACIVFTAACMTAALKGYRKELGKRLDNCKYKQMRVSTIKKILDL